MTITYIKMMNANDKADNDCSKGFELVPVNNLSSYIKTGKVGDSDCPVETDDTEKGKPYIAIMSKLFGEIIEEIYFPEASVYIVNELGKTVSVFC